MKKHLVPLLLVLVILTPSLLGCDSSEGEEESLVGSYTATQVNGRPLPAQAFEAMLSGGTTQVDMLRGTLLLRADMTYRLDSDFRINDQDVDGNDDGDYTVSGNTIRFFPPEEQSYSGTVRGDNIEVRFPDPLFGQGADYTVLFEKQ